MFSVIFLGKIFFFSDPSVLTTHCTPTVSRDKLHLLNNRHSSYIKASQTEGVLEVLLETEISPAERGVCPTEVIGLKFDH